MYKIMTGNYDRIYDPIFINTKYYKTNGWKKKKKEKKKKREKMWITYS